MESNFTQPELCRIAREIPGNWEEVALLTGEFQNFEITNIKRDSNYHDNVQKANKMLNDYKNRGGSREGLAKALEEAKEKELAKKVRSKYYQYLSDCTRPNDGLEIATGLEGIDLEDGPSSSGVADSTDGETVVPTDEAPIVFISYKWAIQEKVEQLMTNIESKGIKCWMDKNEIKGGDVLSEEIDKGIRSCKIFLPCVTKAYSECKESDYCLKELALAVKLKKPIIPLLFEEMVYPPPGHIYFRSDLAYIGCQEDITDEKLKKILKAIRAKMQ